MSSWRRYSNEQKHTSKYNQKSRSENLRSAPSNAAGPVSYSLSKPTTSVNVHDKSVRLTIDFDIESKFLTMLDRVVESVPEPVLPVAVQGPDLPAQVQEPIVLAQPVQEPIPIPTAHTTYPQQILQPQYIRQPNTLVGLYNNMNTGVVTVVRSPRLARPYY
jgi:hypothetical protein